MHFNFIDIWYNLCHHFQKNEKLIWEVRYSVHFMSHTSHKKQSKLKSMPNPENVFHFSYQKFKHSFLTVAVHYIVYICKNPWVLLRDESIVL